MAEVRLQKVIAAAGLASRREAERMITAGRVAIDGQVVTRLGTRVDPQRARIEVDGKRLPRPSARLYLMLNKPRGVLSAGADERGRTTVMDLLGEAGAARGERRVFHVGRLDYNSEGLLLLTNDGQLAMELTHPSSQVPRTYQARVRGLPDAATLERLVAGVELEDGPAAALDVRMLKRNPRSCWIELVLTEGRNRLARRMLQAVGHPVQRLLRVEYGGLELGDLRPGQVRELTAAEVAILKRWRRPAPGPKATGKAGGPRAGGRAGRSWRS